jgi:cytochrome c biogenesis protein CcmG/thiol:disulfide interchange protein DsbE
MRNDKMPLISSRCWRLAAGTAAGVFVAGLAAGAEADRLPSLKVGSEVYSNVIVTSISATDIYFDHAQGVGNAKLKNLDPSLQKRFKYDAAKAGEVEKSQREANARFRVETVNRSGAAPQAPKVEISSDDGDPVVDKLFANSFRGARPPQIVVERWLTPSPTVDHKFVLVVFWSTWAEACRDALPHLNELQNKFKDRLVVMGISDEPIEAMKPLGSAKIDFYFGTDPQRRTLTSLGVTGIPHSILIDPKGTVRFEGVPVYLEEKDLAKLMEKYAE